MLFTVMLVLLPWAGVLAIGAYGASLFVPPRMILALCVVVPWLVALTLGAYLVVATLACAAVDCGLLPRLTSVRRVDGPVGGPFLDDGSSVGSVCPICLSGLCGLCGLYGLCGAAHATAVTACGHAFHAACIARWLARARTCPVCRADLVRPAFRGLYAWCVRVHADAATDGANRHPHYLQ